MDAATLGWQGKSDMRIMVLGAGGFIGRHIMAALLEEGHEVVAIVRSAGPLRQAFDHVRFVEIDLAQATGPASWAPHLRDVDLIVNAAGLLRGKAMEAVHVAAPRALYAAAKECGVTRAVLLSAISARADVPTDYARSKLAGEDVLRTSGLPYTILRPSLVYGDGSYGGTSLLRGLAALPGAIPLPGRGDQPFTPIHAVDLAKGVARVCSDSSYSGKVLEPVGPQTIDLRELLVRYRAWLGFGVGRLVSIPMTVMRLLGRIGDAVSDGPVSSNSLAQLVAGNGGDSAAYERDIGFRQRSLSQALLAHPAQVQDRWHARLFFLAPAIRAMLIFLWLASAWLGFFHGDEATRQLVAQIGWPASLADPLRIGASLADVGVALLLAMDRRARWSTIVQLALIGGYTVVLGLAQPELWLDPLGPLLKNLPILLLVAVHGAVGDKR